MEQMKLRNFLNKLKDDTPIHVWNFPSEGPSFEGTVKECLNDDKYLDERVYFIFGTLNENYLDIVTCSAGCFIKTLMSDYGYAPANEVEF